MNLRTTATLEDLASVEWFRNAGIRDTEVAVVLNSWDEAINSCDGQIWSDLQAEASNQLRERVLARSVERFERWNDVVDMLKPLMEPLVEEKTRLVRARNNLPDIFVHSVRWDILGVCLEAEYSDIVAPAAHSGTAYWYRAGHFPCGWSDDGPGKGRPIVY